MKNMLARSTTISNQRSGSNHMQILSSLNINCQTGWTTVIICTCIQREKHSKLMQLFHHRFAQLNLVQLLVYSSLYIITTFFRASIPAQFIRLLIFLTGLILLGPVLQKMSEPEQGVSRYCAFGKFSRTGIKKLSKLEIFFLRWHSLYFERTGAGSLHRDI